MDDCAEEEYLEDEYYANDYQLGNDDHWYEEDDLHNWNVNDYDLDTED